MDTNKKQKDFQILARLRSFRYAWSGLLAFIRKEHNARIHFLTACIVIISGVYFEISLQEWCLIILAIGLVITSEAFNTAIEYLCDVVQPEFDLRIGKVKDIAAGAVLIAAITSLIIGLIIFVPYIMNLLS